MQRIKGAIVAACAMGFGSGVASAVAAGPVAQHYYVTDLGTPAGVTGPVPTSPLGINDFGQVVGWMGSSVVTQIYTDDNSPPVLWTPSRANGVDGSMMKLPMPFTGPYPLGPFGGSDRYTSGIAFGINARGQISGYAGARERAVLWSPATANGTTFSITDLSNGSTTATVTTAYGINAYGQIAGLQNGHPMVWTPTAPNGTAGAASIVNDTAVEAYAVDDRGDVGGQRFYFRPTDAQGHTGTTLALDYTIWELSDDGLSATATAESTGQGFVLRFSDGPTPTLVSATPVTAMRAWSINNAGVAVGTGSASKGQAWSAADGTVDLSSRLEAHSGSGWSITSAHRVNTLGQIVATARYNGSSPNNYGAVLLTPLTDGDATIDQHVDFADLLTLAKNYGGTGKTWRDGDFTGEGSVAFDDLLLLAKNYGGGTPTALAAEMSDAFAADWALAQSLAPEPVTTAIVLPIVASVSVRRRRLGT